MALRPPEQAGKDRRPMNDFIHWKSITLTSALIGWLQVFIGVVLIVPWFGTSDVTRYFLQDISPLDFGIAHILVGFAVAFPSRRVRLFKHFLSCCLMVCWVGVCLWPLIFPSPTVEPSSIGVGLWFVFGVLIINDAFSPTYNDKWSIPLNREELDDRSSR